LDPIDVKHRLKRLALPVRLTQAGMLAERLMRAVWPLASILLVGLSLAMLGLQDHISGIQAASVAGVLLLAALGGLVFVVWQFRWPTRRAAQLRLDQSLPGRPIQTLLDQPLIGAKDAASSALWQAHLRRTVTRLAQVRPVAADLRLAARDPFALRYAALLAFVMALVFGSFWRVGSVTDVIATPGPALSTGPLWEGWVEPPAYTRLPALYLNDIKDPAFSAPRNSQITLRFYGEVGALSAQETVSGAAQSTLGEAAASAAGSRSIPEPVSGAAQDPAVMAAFRVVSSGRIEISGAGGRGWTVQMIEDTAPVIVVTDAPEVTALGVMSLPYRAQDDYGIQAGEAVIRLDWDSLDRRFGLRVDPEVRPEILLDLPLPITGSRRDISDFIIQDFSDHAWANLPVMVTLSARDVARQTAATSPFAMRLPGRRFFDPLAAAMIELRRDLLWSAQNAPQVAVLLRALSHRPEDVFRSEAAYLRLRHLLHRLEGALDGPAGRLSATMRDEMAQGLWSLAILLEEGDLSDALARLRRAQDRLSEAMKNGASDAEIAELMQEFRDASEAYMRQLGRQQAQDGAPKPDPSDSDMELSQSDLQRMMDRIQELMEQGRMAEAQQALEDLRQMMENMQVTQGQGQGQSPGQQSLDGLSETLRDQQGLSDEAFRDLQNQTNPQNPPQNDPQTGQGRQGSSQSDVPDNNAESGQTTERGETGETGEGGTDQVGRDPSGQGRSAQSGADLTRQSLAERQRALRRELQRQKQALPEGQSGGGDTTREALERADQAMTLAEQALRSNDLAEAINRQSQALDALRNGLKALGNAVNQTDPDGGERSKTSGRDGKEATDPLGRRLGTSGQSESDETVLDGQDVYRRARDLLDEIRRRTGEGERSDIERDYLQRLLERF
jgi:uncharacterized protein (TIGR02302 family)